MEKDNPIIKKRFEEKMARMDKTSASILVSWAINNAVASLSEMEKINNDWKAVSKIIKERYPFFIEEYRDWFFQQEVEKTKALTDEQIKKIDEDWQKKYDEDSQLDDIQIETNKL